ncbi:MFS general substrate transporter [Trichoderma citrinoviride]|uniref:MFS general substrate transporter n=1 Tax=Trichoderma citrinoviride TaxID=58853 RepID=A0A2T4B379_9HYPO|nr:MFS general substrate transporter [Trichoderma citrinoviride]PTB63779.1 MFS general substrate transporter [Trichoderma citrinoviride]
MPAAEPSAAESPSTSPTVTTPSSPTPTITIVNDRNAGSPADSSENEKSGTSSPTVLGVGQDDVETQQEDQHQGYSLPPVDTGKDAWLFLAACFVMEAMVWGFPFAFGIFQEYYRTHEPFAGSTKTAIIGTCAMGIMYLDAPLVFAFARIFPKAGRWLPTVGLLMMCAALALSSFSETTTHLILTQGALYGIGGSIAYNPCLMYVDEWFDRRKGLAFGLMWSGTGLGGFTIPLVLEALLDRYGFRVTLRIWAIALFAFTMPLVYFVKPRLPPAMTAHIKPLDWGFMKNRVFALYQLGNVIEGLGFFLPGIFLPTYARDVLGANPFASAATLLVLNVGSVVGPIAMGTLVDRLHVTTCILISTVGAVSGVLLLWGLGSNMGILYVFSLVYGIFAGSFTTSWPGIMRQVIKIATAADMETTSIEERSGSVSPSRYDPLMVIGFLSIGRGVGNIASGPLSEALVKGMPWQGQAIGGYGSGYGILIIFTGTTALFGCVSYAGRRVGWMN